MRVRTAVVGTLALVGAGVAVEALRRRAKPGTGRHLHRSRLRRNGQLARMGARVGTTYATMAARKTFASAERRAELDRHRELRSAQQVAEELGHMKGALMKLGQMASYLDDGLPEPLRQALSQLQSDAPPMSVDLALDTVERELGRPVEEVFIEFDPTPIAAASIGQVHRALWRDPATGIERAVAVKVQYPGVGEAIVADLKNADLLGAVLRQEFVPAIGPGAYHQITEEQVKAVELEACGGVHIVRCEGAAAAAVEQHQ